MNGRQVRLALVACCVVAGCASPPSAPPTLAPAPTLGPVPGARGPDGFQVLLTEPGGRADHGVLVTILDRTGRIMRVGGTWLEANEPLGDEPLGSEPSAVRNAIGRSDVLDVRWAGGCGSDVTIEVQAVNGTTIELDRAPSDRSPDCRPRGFVHLMVSLWFSNPVPADSVELKDTLRQDRQRGTGNGSPGAAASVCRLGSSQYHRRDVQVPQQGRRRRAAQMNDRRGLRRAPVPDSTWGDPTIPADETQEERNKAMVRRFVEEVQNKRDADAYDELNHADFVNLSAPPGLPTDKEGGKIFLWGFFQAFPDAKWTINDMIAEGDRVATKKTFIGTHTGPLGDLPATGNKVNIEYVDILRLRDGQIVEHWLSMDQLLFMQQLGVIPAQGPANGQDASPVSDPQ